MTSWGTPICNQSSETCDAIILGSIMKGLRSLGLVPDFDKFILKSVNEMKKGIEGLRIEFLEATSLYCGRCSKRHYNDHGHGSESHESTCSFLPELHQKISTAVEVITGLSLNGFKDSGENSAEASVGKWNIFDYK